MEALVVDVGLPGTDTFLVRHARFTTHGVSLHTALDGPEDGPLLIFLHGFPEHSYAWRRYLPHFAERGWLAIAPDQRGYGESDKPKGLQAYVLDELAADVLGLMDHLGRKTACIVGHDWGAAVAWWTAMKHPERVERMVAINVPHPWVMRTALFSSARQLARSWYMVMFQIPGLAERLFARDDGRVIAREIARIGRPDAFSEADLDTYRRAWAVPGTPTAMVSWYRAMRSQLTSRLTRDDARIRPPALLVWGTGDRLLGEELAAPSLELCDDGRLVTIEGATHWVQHEEPARVIAAIEAHLRR